MGDTGGSAPNPNTLTRRNYTMYVNNIPRVLQATIGGQGMADIGAAQNAAGAAPIYNQTALRMLQQFYPQFAQAGATGTNAVAQGNAQAAANTIAGAGGQAAQNAMALQQRLNPEYYGVRGAAGQQAQNLVNSINLNGLSGGEQAAVERSLAQSNTATGNLGIDNATNAVANAMNFGGYLQQKRSALGEALNTATNYLNQQGQFAGFNPAQLAMGGAPAGSSGNAGTAQFAGVPQSGNQAWGMGTAALGGQTSIFNTNQPLNYQAAYNNSIQNAMDKGVGNMANLCCFIFMEAYRGVLPWWVRVCRDNFYRYNPELAVGYRRMSRWLVPMMKRSWLVRFIVDFTMVHPLTEFGGWMCKVGGCEDGWRYHRYVKFWFGVWRQLAKG